MESLHNKKVIFLGDSFVYYGNAVQRKTWELYRQEDRINDRGYFYQLCRLNGENTSVTNFTFGGHSLSAIMSESCPVMKDCHGIKHLEYLTDRCYDYVVMSGGRSPLRTEQEFLSTVRGVMDTFLSANKNTKFVYLVSSGSHNVSVNPTFPTAVLNSLKTIEKWGVIIVDWGKLVADLINGNASVVGGACEYSKTSFIVSRKETDGFHPNPLSGYITALMTYCAITGKSAVGQPYGFYNDGGVDKRFDTDYYLSEYYTYGEGTSNYPEIFSSKEDMLAIQRLIDEYLMKKHYRSYDF